LTLGRSNSVNTIGSGRGEIKTSNEDEVTKERGMSEREAQEHKTVPAKAETHLIIRILPRW